MKGQKSLQSDITAQQQKATADYNAAIATAKAPSAAEVQAEKDRQAYFDWKGKGDYRTPPPGLIGINYGPEAQARRRMEQTATPTGAAGMGAGYANPTALAMTREYLGNVNAENDATAYQSALQGEDMFQRTGNTWGLANAQASRNATVLGAANSQQQYSTGARIQSTPQSILPALISGGLAAGGAFLGGPAFGAMMKP